MAISSPTPNAKVVGKPKLTGNVIANILVIAAIICIPLMYGGILSSAYQDPVENIGHIQAAVVNEDTPYRAELLGGLSETVDAGAMLTDALVNPTEGEDTGFSWTQMDRPQAERDLKDGSIRAVLYIPAGLSQELANIGTQDAAATTRGHIELVTDDGINYLSGTLARTVAATLQDRVTSEGSQIYTEKLLDSLATIRSGMEEAADGAEQLSAGSETLTDGLSQLDEGAQTAAEASTQLNDGAGQLASGLGQMASQVPTLQSGAAELASGSSQLSAGASTLNSSIVQYTRGVDQVAAGAQTLTTQTPQLEGALSALHGGASQVASGSAQLDQQFQQISGPVGELAPLPDEIRGIVNAIGDDVQAVYARLCSDGQNEEDPACILLSQVVAKQAQITQGVDKVADKADAVIAGVGAAQAGLDELAAGSSQVNQGVEKLQASVGTTSDTPESQTVLGAINGINGGLTQLTGNSNALREGAGALADAGQQIAAGTGQLQSQVPTLVDGVTALDAGAQTLAGGTTELREGLGTLAENTGTAAQGSEQITQNTGKLGTALNEGASQIPDYSSAEAAQIAQTASTLIEVEPARAHEVANTGAGFSPMFISLALWIGGIAVFLVLPALDRRPGPGETWWMAAARPAFTAGAFAIVQAVLAVVLTNWLVELHAVNLGGLVGIAILASLTFVAVNQACIATLGYRGRFVSIVLLLLQIASMGATFPIETMPAFFNWIHPFLPMTYTQLSIRSMIAGSGVPGIVGQTVLVLLLWFVVSAALVLVGAYLRTMNHPLPYDTALLPDNVPEEDEATAAELAGRRDLKQQIVERARERLQARGFVAGSRGTLGTVGPRSATVTYSDQGSQGPTAVAVLEPGGREPLGEHPSLDAPDLSRLDSGVDSKPSPVYEEPDTQPEATSGRPETATARSASVHPGRDVYEKPDTQPEATSGKPADADAALTSRQVEATEADEGPITSAQADPPAPTDTPAE